MRKDVGNHYEKDVGEKGGPTAFLNVREKRTGGRYAGDGDVEPLVRIDYPAEQGVTVLLAKGAGFMRISVEDDSTDNYFDLPTVYLAPIAELGGDVYLLDFGEIRHEDTTFGAFAADIGRMHNFAAWGKRYLLWESRFQGDQRKIFDGVRKMTSMPQYVTNGYAGKRTIEGLQEDMKSAVGLNPKGLAHRNLFLLEPKKIA